MAISPPLTSRQRILHAISRQPVDHTPLLLRFWWLGGEVDNIPFNWRDEVQRVEATLAMGLDDTLLLQPPLGYVEEYIVEQAPGVISKTGQAPASPGDQYPTLTKTYQTPAGPLQTAILVTEDWPRGADIHLFDDYNLSRLKQPLIKDIEDLPRLRYLLADPSQEQLDSFRMQAEDLRRQAGRLQVVLDGGWCALGDSAMWLCGMERILYAQMDEPDFLAGLLDLLLEWELKRVDRLLAEGIDVLVHMAWYEGSDFWSPRSYRRLLKPRLKQLVDHAHTHGAKFRYIITRGWKPLANDLLDLGIDCLTGVDPVQDCIQLREAKELIGEKVCLMGGINSAITLTQWSDDEICRAVDEAMATMTPGGGFILYPVDAVFNNFDWRKVEVLIERWKEKNGSANLILT